MRTPTIDTATSRTRRFFGGGHDGRRGFPSSISGAGTWVCLSRLGIRLPNEDVGNTLTLEEYREEGR